MVVFSGIFLSPCSELISRLSASWRKKAPSPSQLQAEHGPVPAL